ncbi:2-oxoacid:acceptor oxidoreductase subunit alpha [Thermotoga profunda]|uniref:2-oxoacid:acceptor oxidoreductase subunit alpha n=1 Tax=Thermotoga profunda TaxID=1508420 RepID=UPI000AE6FC44
MDLSVVICGEAGQGIQTIEYLFPNILKSHGLNVFSYKEYMSRVRGGSNSTLIRISDKPVRAFCKKTDILFSLSPGDVHLLRLLERIDDNTFVFIDSNSETKFNTKARIKKVPISSLALEAGNKLYSNSVVLGMLCGLLKLPFENVLVAIEKWFCNKGTKVCEENKKAVKLGYDYVYKNIEMNIETKIETNPSVKDHILMSGAEAVSLGALAGGCNFVSSYPMSPSTGVLTNLANHSRDFDIIVEQAEDEISAINMALGAWYSGARALVTTSGGGFALMVEALSLAGMIESPIVIHLAQRPGPATGLPTRTEQADLLFALFSGHGEFERVIFSPGNLEQAFFCTMKAFDIADKYQVPVFVLTDQYLMDMIYNFDKLGEIKSFSDYIVETAPDYKRYQFTENGISPRGIPSHGNGLVCVDSDEHDEYGRITEDFTIRNKMVEKRLRKLKNFSDEIPAEFIGNKDFTHLVICFGSTREIVLEASKDFENLAVLHLQQLYPLPSNLSKYLNRAKKVLLVESNATSQLGKLLKMEFGFSDFKTLNKYNGLPFYVEEIKDTLQKFMKGEI